MAVRRAVAMLLVTLVTACLLQTASAAAHDKYSREMMEEVMGHIEGGEAAKGFAILDGYLEAHPDDVNCHADAGAMQLEFGTAGAAVPHFEAILAEIGGDPTISGKLISALQRTGKLELAFKAATKLDLEAHRVVNRRGNPKKSSKPRVWKMFKSGKDEHNSAREVIKVAARQLASLAVYLRHDTARILTKKAMKMHPKEQAPVFFYAAALDQAGQEDEALRFYTRAVIEYEKTPDTDAVIAALRPFARASATGPPAECGGCLNGDEAYELKDGGSGGWGSSAAALEKLPCNIERVDGSKMEPAEFMAKYSKQGKPVIIGGLLDDWKAWDSWQKAALLEERGDRKVYVAPSSDFSRQVDHEQQALTGAKNAAESLMKSQEDEIQSEAEKLKFFKRTMLSMFVNSEMGTAEEDPKLVQRPKLKNLARDFEHPSIFGAPNFQPLDAKERATKELFSLGPQNAGAYFAEHGSAAYGALIYGTKRWFMFPPLSVPFGGEFLSMAAWLKGTYPSLGYKPHECVQRAGEVVYVPSRWQYASINLEDSVGLLAQIGPEAAHGDDPQPQDHEMTEDEKSGPPKMTDKLRKEMKLPKGVKVNRDQNKMQDAVNAAARKRQKAGRKGQTEPNSGQDGIHQDL